MIRAAFRRLRTFAAVIMPALPVLAQERTLQVTVTSVSGNSVYLDRGRSDGLQTGTIVRLLPPGSGPIDVEVRAVSSNSARAELRAGAPAPPVGTRGEAQVPLAQPQPTETPQRPTQPDHPPWARQEGARTPDQPLLVPAFGERPESRPMKLSGRIFTLGQWNSTTAGSTSSDYFFGRLGTSLRLDNPLGLGGRAQFAGELDHRLAHLDDQPDLSDGQGRIDLLSYATGIEEYAPYRFELGRFYSIGLPELGLLDGAEFTANFENGFRIGGGFGAYPEPLPHRDTGEDLSAHLFADYTSGKDGAFGACIGLQQTWHKGSQDRDLLVLRVEGRPGNGFWYYASAKVDFYTSSDTIKGSGPELTEFLGQARWDGTTTGIGALLSEYRWVELQREEFQMLPPALVADGKLDRAELNGWWRPLPQLRLSARVGHWQDQDQSGTAWQLDSDVTDVLASGSLLHAALFQTDGSSSSGPGARLLWRQNLGDSASGSLGWTWQRYDIQGLLSGDESQTRQSFDLGADWYSGSWDFNLTFERWFGDGEDAFSFGLYAQYRF